MGEVHDQLGDHSVLSDRTGHLDDTDVLGPAADEVGGVETTDLVGSDAPGEGRYVVDVGLRHHRRHGGVDVLEFEFVGDVLVEDRAEIGVTRVPLSCIAKRSRFGSSDGRYSPRPSYSRVADLSSPFGLGLVVSVDTLGHREMGHEVIRRRAVPVPLVRSGEDDVAGTNGVDPVTAGLDESLSLGDVQRLTECVRVPGGACPRIEPDRVDSET